MRAAKAQGRADLHLSTIGVCVPVALSGEVGVQPRNNLLALRESGHQDAARHSRGHISSRNNQHTHTRPQVSKLGMGPYIAIVDGYWSNKPLELHKGLPWVQPHSLREPLLGKHL